MLYVLIALPLAFAARDTGKGGSADYKQSNRKNGNPDATISCVLETDKSGAYRPECQGETMKCKKGEDCIIQCLGQADRCAGESNRDCKPCLDATFVGADGYDLTFTCEGDSACQDVTIQCPDYGECNIRLSGGNGDAQYGMKGATIIGAASKGTMTVENNQLRSGMEDASIQCPDDGKCYIKAGEAFKKGYFPGEVIEETMNVDAYKNAYIDGSRASLLNVVTDGADRPFQNANIYCPPRPHQGLGHGPTCDILTQGGRAMLTSMHLHVEESIADVAVNCQYAEDPVEDCYGDDSSSPYEAGSDGTMAYKLSYLPTLECGARGGMLGDMNADCVMILDLDSAGDVFSCENFEGRPTCNAPEHSGGFCDISEESDYAKRGDDDTRMGSKCDRYSDQTTCDLDADCAWQAYQGDSAESDDDVIDSPPVTTAQPTLPVTTPEPTSIFTTSLRPTPVPTREPPATMVAAAKVTISDAFEGNASSSLYLALSLVLFGSSAAVYYALVSKKQVEGVLTFDDDGVTYA